MRTTNEAFRERCRTHIRTITGLAVDGRVIDDLTRLVNNYTILSAENKVLRGKLAMQERNPEAIP